MPIYEFRCPNGHVIEALVPMDTETHPCGVCSGERTSHTMDASKDAIAFRILSATRTNFHFADQLKR